MKAILKFFKELFGKTDNKTQEATTKTEDVALIVEETKSPEIDTTVFVSPGVFITENDMVNTADLKNDDKKTPTRKKQVKPTVKKAPVKKAPVKKTNKKK